MSKLKMLLPHSGYYAITVRSQSKVKNIAAETIDQLTRIIRESVHTPHDAIYLALASNNGWYTDANGKPRLRTKENVKASRAFLLDLDVGPDGYPSKAEAVKALKPFFALYGGALKPWVIDSGGGIHMVLTVEEDLQPLQWTAVSRALDTVIRHLGIRIDPQPLRNICCAIRLPGSLNGKYDPPRVVKLLRPGASIPVKALVAPLKEYMQAHGLKLQTQQQTSPNQPHPDNPFAAAAAAPQQQKPPTSDPNAIADRCAAVRRLRDDAPNVDYNLWFRGLGVLKYAKDGEKTAHEWSAGHPKYTRQETDAKLNSWQYGPTTCDEIDRYAGCKQSCPYAGKVRSPISLGEDPEEPVQSAVPAEEVVAGFSTKPVVPAMEFDSQQILCFPRGYGLSEDGLYATVKDPDTNETIKVALCNTPFYVEHVIVDADTKDLEAGIRAKKPNGEWIRFRIPARLLASPNEMASEMAAKGIFPPQGQKLRALMSKYVMEFIRNLQEYVEEVVAASRFGWVETEDLRGFILGNECITADGTREVALAQSIPRDLQGPMQTSGTLEEWVAGIKKLTDCPGSEPLQFSIAHALASPLVKLVKSDVWHGMVLNLVGPGGHGKTVTMALALSAYGPPSKLIRAGSDDGTTVQALIRRVSMHNNLPIGFDDMNNRRPEDVSSIVFSLVNGMGKERLNVSGNFATTGEEWHLNSFVTSNDSLFETIVQCGANDRTEAAQMRLFEIALPHGYLEETYLANGVDRSHVEAMLRSQYGHAGRKFLEYVVQNKDKVLMALDRARELLAPKNQTEAAERFYRDTVAFAYVAAAIARKLGLIHFSPGNLMEWGLEQIEIMRNKRKEVNTTDEELVARFVNSLWGRTLVTLDYPMGKGRTSKSSLEAPMQELRYSPVARIAVKTRMAMIDISWIKIWSTGVGVSYIKLVECLKKSGLLLDKVKRSITKGTSIPGTPTYVYLLNYDMLENMDADITTVPDDDKITPMRSRNG